MKKIRPASADQRSRYVTGIDGLRTLAVMGVIIYHLFIAQLPGGFLGVPLFLLISGYFVTNQLQNEWDQTQTIDLVRLYKRRFWRLYPPLIGMLVTTVIYITLFSHQLLYQLRQIVVTNLLWVYNWWEIGHGQSYFDRFNGESPFTHLWTLGVEAQFYLIWPALLFIAFVGLGRHRRLIKWLTLLLAVGSAVLMAALYNPANLNRVYYGTDTRAFSLLLGAWLAMVWPRRRLRNNLAPTEKTVLNGAGVISFLILLIGFCTLDGQAKGTYFGGMFAYSLVGTILLATIVHPGASMNRWLTNPVFSWVGRRSYGIYIYQFPIMVFYEAKVQVGAHPFINGLIEVAMILLAAELSYRLVEQPMKTFRFRSVRETLETRPRNPRKLAQLGIAGLMLVAALIGLCLPERAPAKTGLQTHLAKANQTTAARNKLIASGKTPKVQVNAKSLKAKYQLSEKQLKVLSRLKMTVIGDSVMVDAAQNIQELVPDAYVDAQVGRQGSAGPAVINSLKQQGHLAKIVVLNLGTNGPMTTQTIDEILNAIGKDRQIYWINTHLPTKSWEKTVNKQLRKLAKHNANVHLVDWNRQSKGHDSWFANDQVHMDQEGNVQFTRLLVTTILKNH
ncbi:MAG: acyltransferase family protein [Limosilactobacillus gorillae]|jgi:peptidoglycan/LPS O-acetylase OafA/YrhL|uniref:acyltransferase family protein n=1 Tax=Limosilactobacillus gorillae TaxID=1450649 RepID=UPI000B180EEA|nr:acyltransferase family protein [Limosilactobacillus gorillae]MDO4855814.1 acyltransferase family protein [Limosilactobacillus gorillae]